MVLNNMKYLSIISLLLLLSCAKEQIAPANQKFAFLKYFGHVREQQASDMKPTADGGYILIGSSNSFSSGNFNDIYLVKTDTLGNEIWSKTFGDGASGFDEKGVAVVVLANDEGYLIAGNRTTITLVNGEPTPGKTVIVLYKLDLDGVVVWQKELRPNEIPPQSALLRDRVRDIKQTPDGGFILIGETNDVNVTKNEYPTFRQYDTQDILVLKLDLDGNIIWESVRGFVGEDFGSSVDYVNGDFVIIGTAEIKLGLNQNIPVFRKEVLAAKLKGSTGNEIIYNNFGATDMMLNTSYAAFDTLTGYLTVVGHVLDLPLTLDPREGDLMVLQLTEDLIETRRVFYGKTSGGLSGISNNVSAGSIALVPSQIQGTNASFILTATHNVGNGGAECILVKLNSDLSTDWSGQPRFFGRPGENGNWLPGNFARRVFPVLELVPGTDRKELKGYAFTATFNTGTNTMMGLVKTNTQGTMTPE